MKILKEAFTIPDNVVMFYDRHLRLWTLYIKDEEGNQISNTEYTPSKADAIEMAQNIDNFVIRESLKENDMKILKEATWSPVEYDETTGEYYSRPGNEFDGIDPQTQPEEELNEGLQYIESINSRKGIRTPKALTETYHINDEEVMNKVAELGKELESQGFKYVSSKDSRDYYDFYRKIEDGKGVWKAVIYNYGAAEIIDVTYEQARGIEPIDSLEQLRKDLGKMLLPNDNINEALGRDYSHIPEVKQINYSNNKNGNLLPYLNCNRFKAALEETGLEAFKIKSARLRNVSLADLKDEFGGRGMEPWRWRHDFDSSVPMGDGNEFDIFWKGEFPKVEEKLQNEKEDTSEEKEDAKLNEDVEVPTLEGPQEGPEYGLSELINAAIQHELETVNEYNTLALNARAEGFDDIASVIDEINTEENKHIGQLQELLKTISPNAQAIVAGETEASDDLVNVDVE